MAKLAPTSIKYIVKGRIKAKGVIEKPDVIGAVFGQTEGLLGSDLDLRELQQAGKIGRIEVKITSKDGTSEGEITIPSALDAAETSLIAATLETIERIGPCAAKIVLEMVEDTRSEKRKYVVDKARDILKGLMDTGESVSEISESIKESVRTHEISTYKGMPCGPDMEDSEEVIIVEGRADILNLLRYSIRNTVALEGTSIPQAIVDLTKEKVSTLFVDGDRGGQLISKELFQKGEVDFVATAPEGKEVEDLTKKEVFTSLRSKLSAEQYKTSMSKQFRERKKPQAEKFERSFKSTTKVSAADKERFKKTLEELVGTRAACIYSAENELLGKVPVTELQNVLKTMENPHTIIFDGKVDFRLNSLAKRKGVKFLIGMERENFNSSIAILSRKDLE
ncbi:MAG: DNA primase [Candidatus Aenigmarchaeota archaeon]|nr:DNA primase [Candidatus Aenigmarchaeota archaeon]